MRIFPQKIQDTYPFLWVLGGGILMGCTPAPVGAWYLAWVGMIPLWWVVWQRGNLSLILQPKSSLKSSAKSTPKAFSLGESPASLRKMIFFAGLWGAGYHGLAIFWITGIHPMTWMGVPWLASLAIAAFCWIFLTLAGAFLVSLWMLSMFWVDKLVYRKSSNPSTAGGLSIAECLGKILIGTALWCGLEGLFSLGDLWWTSLSYTQSPENLAILQLGKISGPNTITAAIVAINGFLATGIISWQTHGKKLVAGGVGLLITLHLMGWVIYSQPIADAPEQSLKVGIIQGNIPNTIKLYPEGWRKAIAGYTSGYGQLADQGVVAVLTPETALPFLWSEQVSSRSTFYQAVLDKGVMVWIGGFGREGNRLTNSLFTVTGKGETVSQYNKFKLVPLGEYIPFEQFIGGLINRLSPLDAKLQGGKLDQILDTPLGRVVAGICYESAFSRHFRRQAALGGELMITASNNAHYSPAMPAQHHAQDVLRAVEIDRWAVRATNTGYSGIVDPHGNTLWLSGINTYETHAHTVYKRQTQTWYVRWGDWLTPVLLLLGLLNAFTEKLYTK